MIFADNISFGYDNKMIFSDVTVRLQPGTITGLLGPSGAGHRFQRAGGRFPPG